MEFGYSEITADAGSIVQVTLDRQANVLLLDPSNYQSFRSGHSFHYHGGWASSSPTTLRVPYAGHWYVVIDPQGGSVQYSVAVL